MGLKQKMIDEFGAARMQRPATWGEVLDYMDEVMSADRVVKLRRAG